MLFQRFGDLGFIIGFLLVFAEAFLPILPLVFIVILNINSYGVIVGFLVSYAASVAGSYLVFLTVRSSEERRGGEQFGCRCAPHRSCRVQCAAECWTG